MRTLRLIRLSIVSGSRHFWRQRKQALGAVLVIAIMLVVLAATAVAARAVVRTVDLLESRLAIVAYLRSDVSSNDIDALHDRLTIDTRVREVVYVSPQEALERLKLRGGKQASSLDALRENPLPASLEVRPASAGLATDLALELAGEMVVEEVISENEIVEKVIAVSRFVLSLSIAVAAGSVVVALFVMGNALRLSVNARRREIAAMRLLGGTQNVITAPFIVEGVISATLGTLLGFGIWQLLAYVARDSAAIARIFPVRPEEEFVYSLWLGLFSFALFVATLSARTAVRAHLRTSH